MLRTRRCPAVENIGRATVMSLRWPVAIHGVFVTSTSPGDMLSRPISLMKCLTVTGSVPMNEGMLSVFWAERLPAASVSTQAKSFELVDKRRKRGAPQCLGGFVDGRNHTRPENFEGHGIECSARSRRCMISRGHGCPSYQLSLSPNQHAAACGDLESTVRADDQSRFTLLDNGWSREMTRQARA